MSDSDKEKHPSFGVIRVTRVQGGDRRLFGSKVTHHHFMTVELLTASRERHLSQEWIYPRQIVASVAMSEAQWATFVSSPNVGSGVPCTIEYMRDGDPVRVDPLPDPKPERETARQEFGDRLDDAHELFDDARARIQKMIDTPGSVRKSDLGEVLQLLQQLGNLRSNLTFAQDQFERAMERSVTEAKAEVDAYLTMTLGRLGLENAIGAQPSETLDVLPEPDGQRKGAGDG